MKHIILFTIIFLSLNLTGQRDSLDYDALRTYISADTTTIDDEEIELTFEWYSPQLGNVTEIDTFFTIKSTAIDDLVTMYQADSVYYEQTLNAFFDEYVRFNTLFTNTVRRLAKYWAIKP